MHIDWLTLTAQVLFYGVAVLSVVSLFRDPRAAGSAIVGTLIYWPAAIGCFIAIAFRKPRRALPKYATKAWRATGNLLHECGRTLKWLVAMTGRRLKSGRPSVGKARSSDLGREESGGRP